MSKIGRKYHDLFVDPKLQELEMHQKLWERAWANRTDTRQSNYPKLTSMERMRNERHDVESLSVESKPEVGFTSRAALAINIDTDRERKVETRCLKPTRVSM